METPCRFKMILGHTRIESRMRSAGNSLIGEGRSQSFDEHGALVHDTGWQPTGVSITFPEPEPRPWWKFWG